MRQLMFLEKSLSKAHLFHGFGLYEVLNHLLQQTPLACLLIYIPPQPASRICISGSILKDGRHTIFLLYQHVFPFLFHNVYHNFRFLIKYCRLFFSFQDKLNSICFLIRLNCTEVTISLARGLGKEIATSSLTRAGLSVRT